VVDLAFGHGKFQCIGKAIALMELNKVAVEVSVLRCKGKASNGI
jgi:cytochrome P450